MSHLKITIKSTKSGIGLYCIACTGYKLSFFYSLKLIKNYHKQTIITNYTTSYVIIKCSMYIIYNAWAQKQLSKVPFHMMDNLAEIKII